MSANWINGVMSHVAISVKDMDRELRFYREVLGFAVDFDIDHRKEEKLARVVGMPGADLRTVMLQGYGFRVELIQYYFPRGQDRTPQRQCDFGLIHFSFSVKNIEEIYQRLLANGLHFNCPPQIVRPGVKATYFQDPEGITIELAEYE
jgi:catechol 2,3-dioxygenase-like lactoylglutathione lyase family enzyme